MARHNFKKLKIWEEGMQIVDETYKMIRGFPDFERFNLTSQLIRCAVSIPSNISEGTGKSSDKHLNKYLEDSLGSAFEWETQLIVAHRQKYVDQERFNDLENKIQQLQRMITGFQSGLSLTGQKTKDKHTRVSVLSLGSSVFRLSQRPQLKILE